MVTSVTRMEQITVDYLVTWHYVASDAVCVDAEKMK